MQLPPEFKDRPEPAMPVWLAYILLVLTALFWSGTTIVGRAATGEIPPFSLAFWRWLVAFLVFMPFGLRPFLAQRARYRRYWGRMAGFAFFGIAGFTISFFFGMQHTSAINGSLLQAAGPVIIVLTSLLVLGTRLSAREIVGTVLSIIGSMLIVLHGDIAALGSLEFGLGDIFIVLSMLSWAIYTVSLKWKPAGLDQTGFIFALAGLAIPMLLPFYLWDLLHGRTFAVSPTNLGFILYAAVFSSVLAYLFWNRSVDVVGPNIAGFSHYLIPVFGTVLSVVLLGEVIQPFHLAAIALTFTGLYLTTRNRDH